MSEEDFDKLYRETQDLQEKGRNASRIARRYDWDAVATAFTHLYREIAVAKSA